MLKKIALPGVRGEGISLLVNEVKMLAMLRHDHIVRLRGAFVEPEAVSPPAGP